MSFEESLKPGQHAALTALRDKLAVREDLGVAGLDLSDSEVATLLEIRGTKRDTWLQSNPRRANGRQTRTFSERVASQRRANRTP